MTVAELLSVTFFVIYIGERMGREKEKKCTSVVEGFIVFSSMKCFFFLSNNQIANCLQMNDSILWRVV